MQPRARAQQQLGSPRRNDGRVDRAKVAMWWYLGLLLCLARSAVSIQQQQHQPAAVAAAQEEAHALSEDHQFAQFAWLGPEVTGAARERCGCGATPCRDLAYDFHMDDAVLWGTQDKPLLSPEVASWARQTATLGIQAAKRKLGGPLKKGQIEAAFQKMQDAAEPYKPADRILHVKVVKNKVYLVGSPQLDAEPTNLRMMSYWSKDLLRGLLKLLKRSSMPDWEAIFTCTANAQDILQPFKPGIPVFTHCSPTASGPGSHGVAITIPRPYALWSPARQLPRDQSQQELQQILQDKRPTAMFRGALSGPTRIRMFTQSAKPENKPYLDVGMTKVPFGAPCEDRPAVWCTGQNGPAGWVKKYDLQPGQFLTPAEQMDYRYIIVTDGVGCPDRLGTHSQFNLGSNSAVLWQRSSLEEFWFRDLQPWVHYIPITENFTNVAAMVSYFNNKLEDLSRIVFNAQEYVRTYHTPTAWLEFLHQLLCMYANEFMSYQIDVPPHAVQVVLDDVSPAGAM